MFDPEIIKNMIEGIGDKEYKKIVNLVIKPNMTWFCKCPGARSHHHNYEGGLADHTIEVLDLVDKYGNDLLRAGAILHDIGKMNCYTFTKEGIEKTINDAMLGHFMEGINILRDCTHARNVNYEYVFMLEHLIASHHGPVSNGWGSLVDPLLPEAELLHQADLFSARIPNDLRLK